MFALRTLSLASIALLSAMAFVAPAAFAQEPTADASAAATLSAPTHPIDFDVAIFKLHDPGKQAPTVLTMPAGGDSLTVGNRPLHDLIRYAFAKTRGGSFQLSGQPSWVDDDRYDIQAKVAPEDLAEWQKLNQPGQKIALQGFLIQYLKLKYHQDTSPHAFFALVVSKNGLKMKPYQPGDTFKTPDGQVVSGTGILQWVSGSEVVGQSIRMPRLADQLAGHADRGILDQTGLTDAYNFDIRFNDGPNPYNPDGPNVPFLNLPPDSATPSIVSAVKQLGLELVPTKGPMDGIVVDHIERPPQD